MALLLLVTCAIFSSCEKIKGTGDIIPYSRALNPFNGIILAMNCDVDFVLPDVDTAKVDTPYKVTFCAESNIADDIETNVEGGNLIIRMKGNKILKNHPPIKMRITAPDVSYINVYTPASIVLNFRDSLVRNFLHCNIVGTATINLRHVRYSYLKIDMTGPGYVFCDSISEVKTANLTNTGSGNIDLLKVPADTVHASLTGAGDISVNVSDLLNVTLTGSGNIWFKGNPTEIKSNITGTGKLIPL